jgi:hypothetical protein
MGAFPSENFFKIMQFSPKSNFTSGFLFPLREKMTLFSQKLLGMGTFPRQ